MENVNEVRLSGTIEKLREVQTKTGIRMTAFLLCQDKSKFACVAFKNIAETILLAGDGSNVIVSGSGSINSWKDSDNNWRNQFQLSCWTVEVAGQTVSFDKEPPSKPYLSGKPGRQQKTDKPYEPPQQDEPPLQEDPHGYNGGPF